MLKDELAYAVVGCALRVHAKLGPGLLESVYKKALMIELDNEGLLAEDEVAIDVIYEGCNLGVGFRMDMMLFMKDVILELGLEWISLLKTQLF